MHSSQQQSDAIKQGEREEEEEGKLYKGLYFRIFVINTTLGQKRQARFRPL
jgi:hypothetical protein